MTGMTAPDRGKKNLQLRLIRAAYERTADDFLKGIRDEDRLPLAFKRTRRYQRFRRVLRSEACGGDDPEIKRFLDPRPGMKFLDIGSGANLITRKLHEWPSEYYGVDISPKLIRVSKEFARRRGLATGGLRVADAADLPFPSRFFDIASAIGVLEYYDLVYIRRALREVHRVLKPQARFVVDMPNLAHPDIQTMIEYEGYLGRPRHSLPTRAEFEVELRKHFVVEGRNDSRIMTGYFVRRL
jgi:SAM-dependent methyltransferase